LKSNAVDSKSLGILHHKDIIKERDDLRTKALELEERLLVARTQVDGCEAIIAELRAAEKSPRATDDVAVGDVLPETTLHQFQRKGLDSQELIKFFFEGRDRIQSLTEERNDLRKRVEEMSRLSAEMTGKVEMLSQTRSAFLSQHNPVKYRALQEEVERLNTDMRRKDNEILTLKHDVEVLRGSHPSTPDQDGEDHRNALLRTHLEETTNEIAIKRKELLEAQQELSVMVESKKELEHALESRRKRLRDIHNSAVTLSGVGSVAGLLCLEEGEDADGKRVKLATVFERTEAIEAQCGSLKEELNTARAALTALTHQHQEAEILHETFKKSSEAKTMTLESALQDSVVALRNAEVNRTASATEASHFQGKYNEAIAVLQSLRRLTEGLTQRLVTLKEENAKLLLERNILKQNREAVEKADKLSLSVSETKVELKKHHALMIRALQLQQLSNDLRVRSQGSTSSLLDENENLRKELAKLREQIDIANLDREAAQEKAAAATGEANAYRARLTTLEQEATERSAGVHPLLKSFVRNSSNNAQSPPSTASVTSPSLQEQQRQFVEEVQCVKKLLTDLVKDVVEAGTKSGLAMPSPPLPVLPGAPSAFLGGLVSKPNF